MKHVKIVVTLSIVVLIASVMVFYVEAWTTPIIDEYNFEQANLAKFEVLPLLEGSDSLEADLSYDLTGTSITEVIVIPGKGYIYTAEFQGFQSIITYMVGIDTNGTITGYKALIQGDTPGLGAEIAKDWYADQFPGVSINDLSGIDGWTGATITFGGSAASLSKVMDFHNSTFEGVVLETPAEKLARWKIEITEPGAVMTDVSGDYDLSDGLTKVELVNDGSTDIAVIYTAEFGGYVAANVDADEIVEYIVAFDLETNDVIGFRVVYNGETMGIGSVISDESFQTQFDSMLQLDAFEGNIDEVAGSSAPITYGSLKASLTGVVEFHQSAFEGAVIETPEQELARWKTEITVPGAVITDVSGDYTLAGPVIKVELANDGTTDVGVIYTVEFDGYVDVVEYIVAFDLATNDITGVRITYNGETMGIGSILSDESFRTQFEAMLQLDAFNGNIDLVAGSSAPITYGGFKDSLTGVVEFHQAAFEGAVIETPEEELARWKTEITVPGAVITDVSGGYTLTSPVTKVELANDGSTDVSVIYTVEFSGFAGIVEYIIAFDLTTNDITGLRIVENNETSGIGTIISDESFQTQFEAMLQLDAFEGNIDEVAGGSAPVTYSAFRDSLNKVVSFHIVEFEGGIVVIPDPEETTDANLLLAFPGASIFTSVYPDYAYIENILNIYEVKNELDEIIGYVYYGHNNGYFGNEIQFVWGVDLEGVSVEIAILNDTQSWDLANEWASYNGSAGVSFPSSSWLNNFEGVTLESILATAVDGVAGVSTTTGAMISVIEEIAQYHTDESVGGGN